MKSIMVQGTMSGVGKSLLTIGLCRIFKQDGRSVTPFKAQNISSFSTVLKDGKRIASIQAMQAEAAGTKAKVEMNPILYQTNEKDCEIYLNGESFGKAGETSFSDEIQIENINEAVSRLSKYYDTVVAEGSGSPVEINLKKDIANIETAKLLRAPILLVGDIERGGVFAQIVGTLALLDESARKMVKGIVINKFHGDPKYFADGRKILEDITGIPVVGVVPYTDVGLEEEDCLFVNERKHHSTTKNEREAEYEKIAALLREHCDIKKIYEILERGI